MPRQPSPDGAVSFLSYAKKDVKYWGTQSQVKLGWKNFLGYSIKAWVHIRKRLEYHPILTISASRTGDTFNCMGYRPNHGLYIDLGIERDRSDPCEGESFRFDEGTWFHMAFVIDTGNTVFHIFKDGKREKTCDDMSWIYFNEDHLVTSTEKAFADIYDFAFYRMHF